MHDSRRTRLVLSVLLIAAIVLITLDFKDGGTSPARGVGADIFGPVEQVGHDVADPVTSLFDSITGGPSAQSTIAGLQAQNAQLRAELSAAQLSDVDEAQLSKLLQLTGRGGYRIVAASIIAAGGDYSDSVTLDIGSKDGVKPEETVLNGDGLVGTVTQVSSDTSTVLLSTDATSVVGVRLAGSNEIGEVTGTGKSMTGGGMLKLTLFNANVALQPGQQLVTFASVGDAPFVPGVPVGTVVSVQANAGSLTQTALVRPFVDFTTLGVVGVVIQGPRVNPRDSVLPHPAPKVTVTVTARPSPSSTAPVYSDPNSVAAAGG
ncbi:MAG TPA: rod shape-determining protein MreC [Streptosporangiaceae bacterium]|nr:rod shape-determining protein MreC [Streptosporangiaceae bacterium]